MTFLYRLALSFDIFYGRFYNSTSTRNETAAAIDRANLYRRQKLFHSNRLSRESGRLFIAGNRELSGQARGKVASPLKGP